MHTCPECGQACTCNGDIDDCLDICEDDADNCIHDCGFSDDDEDDGFGVAGPAAAVRHLASAAMALGRPMLEKVCGALGASTA